MFNLVGAMFYLVVAACAALASARSKRTAIWYWASIALLFTGFAAWRLWQGEAAIQAHFRALAMASGSYANRHAWQSRATVAALLLAFAAGWMLARLRLTRPILLSSAGGLALLGYSLVRMLSFHPVDTLVYASLGPIHLNHIIDMGLAAVVLWGALLALRARPQERSA